MPAVAIVAIVVLVAIPLIAIPFVVVYARRVIKRHKENIRIFRKYLENH